SNEFGTFAPDSINEITTPPAPGLWEYRPTGTEATLLNIDLEPGSNFGLTVGVGGNIRRTFDGGYTWDSVAAFTTSTLFGVHVPWYNTAVVAGSGNLLRRTTNGGMSWYQPTTPYPTTGPSWTDMSFLNDWEGLVAGSGGVVLKTTDAGETWTPLAPVSGISFRSVQMVSSLTYVAGASTGQVSVTHDGGITWNTQLVGSAIRQDAVVFFNDQVGVVGSPFDNVIYRTVDGGATWNAITLPLPLGLGVRRGSYDQSGTGYLAAIDGTVFISTDLGATWQASPTGFSGVIYAVRPQAPGLVYAAGDFGTVFVRDSRPSDVTMYVDMRSAMQSGLFNSAIDTLTLRGGTLPLQWTGFNHMMTDNVGSGIDSIYQVSFQMPDPGPLEYKFVIRHRGTDFWERAQTTNRLAMLPRGGVGYGHTFDDRPDQFTLEVGQYAPGANVVGLWHLDEDTLDHVVWGSGGALIVDNSARSVHGSTTGTTMVPGRHGRARFFSGAANTGISLEQGFFYGSPLPYSFTTELWVNLNQYPSMNSAAVFSGGKYEAVIGISTSGRLQTGIRGGSMTLDSSAIPVELNRWVHLAMQFDASSNTMRGFIDGQLVIDNFLGALFSPGSTFSQAFIGGGPGFGLFRGTIDE
ncbi:MAG: YCF48-related protein, partial [Bacteroidota bacterium]